MTLKEKAERHIGIPIGKEIYHDALALAEQKLNRINERYGTNHGEDYLAMLIAEQVQFMVFSDFFNKMHYAKVTEEKRQARKTARPSQPTTIIT